MGALRSSKYISGRLGRGYAGFLTLIKNIIVNEH